MNKCKITVLKRMVNQQLIDQCTGEEYRLNETTPCPYMRDGQEFWADDLGALPEGFCAWAWANIHAEVVQIPKVDPCLRQDVKPENCGAGDSKIARGLNYE